MGVRGGVVAGGDRPVKKNSGLGQVAGMAAKTLKQAGVKDAYRLTGGISGWRQQGLPLVRRS